MTGPKKTVTIFTHFASRFKLLDEIQITLDLDL